MCTCTCTVRVHVRVQYGYFGSTSGSTRTRASTFVQRTEVLSYFRTFVLPKYNVVHIDSLSIISYVLVVHVRVGVQLYTYVYAYYCSVK